MFQSLPLDALRLTAWLVLLAVVFVPLERLFALHDAKIWRRGIAIDVGYYFLSSLLPAAILSLPLAYIAIYAHQLMPAPFQLWVTALPLWAKILAGLVVGEVGFYWGHRWSHEIPFLWQFHEIHHVPEHMDFLVNTRAHPVDMVFTRLCGMVPLYILGLGGSGSSAGDSAVPAIVVIVGTVWGFFIHANLSWRFGPLEWLLASPAFHHWHHVQSGPINRNYSAMLPGSTASSAPTIYPTPMARALRRRLQRPGPGPTRRPPAPPRQPSPIASLPSLPRFPSLPPSLLGRGRGWVWRRRRPHQNEQPLSLGVSVPITD